MHSRGIIFFVVLGTLACLITVAPATASVVYVKWDSPNNGPGNDWDHAYHTVAAGLTAAVSGDEVWVAAGTYFGQIMLKLGVGLYGGFVGNETQRGQRNWTTNASILDANHVSGAIVVTSPSGATFTTRIDGFTIRNGGAGRCGVYCSNSSPTIANNTITSNGVFGAGGSGGGIYCSNSSPSIMNNTIALNHAGNGGGIYCSQSSPTISNNTISDNIAATYGAGVYCGNSSSPTISGNTITGNHGTGNELRGGGIHCNSSTPLISNNTIAENSAVNTSGSGSGGFGAGIYCILASPVISDNTITDNVADYGGGIYCYLQSAPTIANNTVSGNTAKYGGGIACFNSPAIVTNNVISANHAVSPGPGSGGGIYCANVAILILGNTIVGNNGGGVYATTCSPTVCNNIVAFNSWGMAFLGASTPTLRGNDAYNPGGSNYSGVSNPTGTNGNISADPLFEDRAGGDCHLRQGSPCIEAGNDAFVQPGDMDMDGTRRTQGAGVDIGADEFPVEGGTGLTWARLHAPAFVRPGRDYVLWLQYGNSGSADEPMPLFSVSNSNGVTMRIGQKGRTSTTSLALIGVPPSGSTSLPPGYEGTIPITFTAPWSGEVQFDLAELEDSESVNWPAIEPMVRPPGVGPDDPAWIDFWDEATAGMGSSWREVVEKLGILVGNTEAPRDLLADLTGVLDYALTLAGELTEEISQECSSSTYDPTGDVTATPIGGFDCARTCTYVVTHGWNPNERMSVLAYAIKADCPTCNVVEVKWPEGANRTLPWCAAANIAEAGDEAHNKIRALCGAAPPDPFWGGVTYVGHSFGNSVNARIAGKEGGRGKAIILDPPNPLGGSDSNYDGKFRGGSVAVGTSSLGDAGPCMSPYVAGSSIIVGGGSLDHGGALECLIDQLDIPGGNCDRSPLMTRTWPADTQRPGCYDGTISCANGEIDETPNCPPCGMLSLFGRLLSSAIARVVSPIDPNEKVGPAGEGEDKLVSVLDELEYTIYFENAPNATAPVQEAVITDDLTGYLDWTTFHLEEIAFGDKIVPIDGGSSYTGSVDIPNLRVDLIAGINTQTGRAEWILRAIDPATGLPPADPFAGFLPPNDPATHSGEGHVRFRISPKADVLAGTVISNIASIVFDGLPPILTPPVSNMIGDLPPGMVDAPAPADAATGVATNTVLSWSPATRTTLYDLYIWPDGQPRPAIPAAASWPATGYQPMADFATATTYRWQVVSKSTFGETPGPEWTFTAASMPPIGMARSVPNDQQAEVTRAIVSAAFPDFFYIEADDRVMGIRVEEQNHGLSAGMRADVRGPVKTNADGERYVEATWAVQNGTGSVDLLGICNKAVGGSSWFYSQLTGAGQRGITDAVGLNNIGLLVATFGKFTKTSDSTFTLDDGSGVTVKCVVPASVALDPAWKYVAVTGISSCEKVGEELHRLLRVRGQEDIKPLLAGP